MQLSHPNFTRTAFDIPLIPTQTGRQRKEESPLDNQKPFKENLFMLRIWQDKEGDSWRASLKNMRTKEVKYFHNLELFSKYTKNIKEKISKEER